MVTEMKRKEVFDFAATLKGPLQNRKPNTNGGVLNWRQVKWLHYEKLSPYSLFYKTELDNLEYLEVKLNKKGKSNVNLIPKNAYDESLAISNEKKKDLIDMLPYISSVYHEFYKNIKSRSDIRNIYPDTIEDEEHEIDVYDTQKQKKKD